MGSMLSVNTTNRVVESDDDALAAVQSELGTSTTLATVNEALRLAAGHRKALIASALDELAKGTSFDREIDWRWRTLHPIERQGYRCLRRPQRPLPTRNSVEMLGIEPRSICYVVVLLRAQSTGNCRDHFRCVRQQ